MLNMKPTRTEQLKKLTRDLNNIINGEVRNRSDVETPYKEKFDNLVYDISRLFEESVLLMEDYKFQGLTFNTIEAEGYHRAMLTVKSIIDEYKN